jgi:CheY-like chemotaxis protein
MDDLVAEMNFRPRPTADRPLLGLTVLVVEDSRYASEAMRLLCLRSGARIRRADCLQSARRHLNVYRPSVAIVDLGLPDGSGADLLADMAAASPRVPVILGTSGADPGEAAAVAMDAGADGFLPKPLNTLAAFHAAILIHLPPALRPAGPRRVSMERITPDISAYREDLVHAMHLLALDRPPMPYLGRFLMGVARAADDAGMEHHASALDDRLTTPEKSALRAFLSRRLQQLDVAI